MRAMKLFKFLLTASACLLLSGCQTMDNLMKDFNTLAEQGTNMPRMVDASSAPSIEDNCPRINIVDELSSLSEFAGDMTENNLVSRVNLYQVESSCSIQRKQVSIDLKLAFDGSLGPKAKMRNNDKPFFSYPFFVAVTNQDGVVLAKEVFAASMTYERNEDTHTYYENLRQLIPIGNADQASRFTVMLGFQLSEDQLDYNRRFMVPVAQELAPIHNETKAAAQNTLPAGM